MADQFIIAVAKRNHNVLTETDINNYVFHSAYNTFKIIKTGVYTFPIGNNVGDVTKTLPHKLDFIPLVHGFAAEAGQNQAFPPNTENYTLASLKGGLFGTGLKFRSIAADATNIIFKFNNTGPDKTVSVRYYCLEAI